MSVKIPTTLKVSRSTVPVIVHLHGTAGRYAATVISGTDADRHVVVNGTKLYFRVEVEHAGDQYRARFAAHRGLLVGDVSTMREDNLKPASDAVRGALYGTAVLDVVADLLSMHGDDAQRERLARDVERAAGELQRAREALTEATTAHTLARAALAEHVNA